MLYILNGNYLDDGHGDCTIMEIMDDYGRCMLKTAKASELGFEPEWRSFTLRGYGKIATVPESANINMDGAVERWQLRYAENGAITFYVSQAERDKNLVSL